jgi:beta-glucuronidase
MPEPGQPRGANDIDTSRNQQERSVTMANDGRSDREIDGLLYPQQNHHREVQDLSGIWDFQLDPEDVGEAGGWMTSLPDPRPIPVPCSWNDLFDDARNYLGTSWYLQETWVPKGWSDRQVFLRIGSANYSAKVWINGEFVIEHHGGHLPFVADVSQHLAWDRANVIAIAVENRQLPERVPPGPVPGGTGIAHLMRGFPATNYDFFPYSGLHRPVVLFAVPSTAHIEDLTVVTSIDGDAGIVDVTVETSDAYSGRGVARIGDVEAELGFESGTAHATLRIESARFWGPSDPHLYPLTVTLNDGDQTTDSYTLDIGIRTVEVQGDHLLLNGLPIKLTGFGKHEDYPVTGRGSNLPVWVRDYELLKWVGANSYRTAHYPYAEEAMQLADRLGVLVINETPAVGLNFNDPRELSEQRQQQCLVQLRELIARDKNHPSTIMWSVANEPFGGAVPMFGIMNAPEGAVEFGTQCFNELYDEANRLDGTRPVTFVGFQGGARDWHGIFDVVCINRYYGWYTDPGQLEAAFEHLAAELDELHQVFGKPVMINEFGADTLPGVHNTPAEMWTEEYQVEFLRGYLDVADERPYVFGMHVWAFADFRTGQSVARSAGMNFKGVFTRDRRPKMAAHFLKSRWSKNE